MHRAQRPASVPNGGPPSSVKTGVFPHHRCNRPYTALQRRGGKVNTSFPLPSFVFTLIRRKRIPGIFLDSGRILCNVYPCWIITGNSSGYCSITPSKYMRNALASSNIWLYASSSMYMQICFDLCAKGSKSFSGPASSFVNG